MKATIKEYPAIVKPNIPGKKFIRFGKAFARADKDFSGFGNLFAGLGEGFTKVGEVFISIRKDFSGFGKGAAATGKALAERGKDVAGLPQQPAANPEGWPSAGGRLAGTDEIFFCRMQAIIRICSSLLRPNRDFPPIHLFISPLQQWQFKFANRPS